MKLGAISEVFDCETGTTTATDRVDQTQERGANDLTQGRVAKSESRENLKVHGEGWVKQS
jgi:hypothetical protein